MRFFGRLFPYSNLHDLNLDWIMQKIQDLEAGSAEELAQILAQGISGEEFHWSAQADELIVRDAQEMELYRIKWDGDGFTLTQGEGTPLTYRVSNGTLTAPTVNGTVIRGGSAAITGDVACGSATVSGAVTCGTIVPSTPVDVTHGGTGATTAAVARANLGAMEDATVPITKGGTGATTAAAARTALGAMADATVPISKGGTGATTAAAARTALGLDGLLVTETKGLADVTFNSTVVDMEYTGTALLAYRHGNVVNVNMTVKIREDYTSTWTNATIINSGLWGAGINTNIPSNTITTTYEGFLPGASVATDGHVNIYVRGTSLAGVVIAFYGTYVI